MKRAEAKIQQNLNLVETFAGIKIQIYFLITSLITTFAYVYFDSIKISDKFVIFMLRVFTVTADLGAFLAIAYLVEFRRNLAVIYLFKIFAFISLDDQSQSQPKQLITKLIVIPFGLFIYYKMTLFIIIKLLSYAYEDEFKQKQSFKETYNDDQKQGLIGQSKTSKIQQRAKIQQRSKIQYKIEQRISRSLNYHLQLEIYKKVQIFYFIIYHTTCLLLLFPLQEYLLDYPKAISLSSSQQFEFISLLPTLSILNKQIISYLNIHTIINVLGCWGILLVQEFYIKKKYPQLVKSYMKGILDKFLLITLVSGFTLIVMLNYIQIANHTETHSPLVLWDIINIQIFGIAFLIHALLPIFISFLLLRIYLGHVYSLNRLISNKYCFYKNDDDTDNLDQIIYNLISLPDIVKVRYFKMSQRQLIPRHQLKKYIQKQSLINCINQGDKQQLPSLFQDSSYLQMYNKISRLLSLIIFYLLLLTFLLSLNVNDSYIITSDNFFPNKPIILLFVGLLLKIKYQSMINSFYPKFMVQGYSRISEFFVKRKAFNVIRLAHVYLTIAAVYMYRLVSYYFTNDYHNKLNNVKQTLYDFYHNQSYNKNQVISDLLQGFSQYFITNSQQCDFSLDLLIIDTLMLALLLTQVLTLSYYYTLYKGKWDSTLTLLKFVTPIYLYFIFIHNMECLEGERIVFAVFVTIAVVLMRNNQYQLYKGIKRDQQGQHI